MPRSPPNAFGELPDAELAARNCTMFVLNAYTIAMTTRRNQLGAFEAAVRAWRERNPEISEDAAPRAVAAIICKKI